MASAVVVVTGISVLDERHRCGPQADSERAGDAASVLSCQVPLLLPTGCTTTRLGMYMGQKQHVSSVSSVAWLPSQFAELAYIRNAGRRGRIVPETEWGQHQLVTSSHTLPCRFLSLSYPRRTRSETNR